MVKAGPDDDEAEFGDVARWCAQPRHVLNGDALLADRVELHALVPLLTATAVSGLSALAATVLHRCDDPDTHHRQAEPPYLPCPTGERIPWDIADG